ncbi:MAG: glycosyltransferase family 2 protein [Deltaproteobacteria bacterium]|nr:glycosyltransferase family 2 protein [Deltaproteobacteria bacterium]
MQEISLSIIIPAYNEETRLPLYLDSILAYLEPQDISYEIIVVDDGSVDFTAKVVERYVDENACIKLIRLPCNRGKGYAVKTGMIQACGSLRLFTDADGSTPIKELERLRDAIDSGADVAIGSRALLDDSCTIEAHLHRKLIGSIFNFLVSIFAVKGIKDTQCGFKLFTARSAASAFSLQRIDDFGFDVEILFICNKNGYRVSEVPVNWADVKGSKVSLIRDSFRMFTDIFKIRLNDLKGYYRS